MDWGDFFNAEHSIYANARHKTLHADAIARGIIAHNDDPAAQILDYGCGEALGACAVAAHCAKLYLYDASAYVRAKLHAQFVGDERLIVLDDQGVTTLPDASLDRVMAISVLQYLDEAQCARLLDTFATKLKPGGQLILGDIVPHTLTAVEDARALMTFAFRGGFFFAALASLARTALSDYRQTRARYGLTRYSETEILELLRDHGFSAKRAPANIGHNQQRMTIVATLDETY